MAPSFGLSSSSATSEFYGARSRCSFKTATAFICACNVIVGIYFLRLLSPAYFFSSSSSPSVTLFRSTSNLPYSAKFIEAQSGHIREALNVWRKAEPVDLIKRVQQIRRESPAGVLDDEQLELLRENVTFEIIKIMEELKAAGNGSWKHQKVALEQWRKRNLEDLDTLAEETKGGKTEAQRKAQEAGMARILP